MICKKCGANISDDSAFCPNCGKKLNSLPSTFSSNSSQNNISSERKNKNAGIVFFIATIIIVCFITSSEGIALGVCICSLVLCPILFITGIIKRIIKKPSGKPLYFSGLLFVVLCISMVNYSLNSPTTGVYESEISTKESADTLISSSSSTETLAPQTNSAEADASAETASTTGSLAEDEEKAPKTDTTQAITNDSPDNTAPVPSNNSSDSYKNSEYIGSDLWLINCSDYSEGRAWVQYNETAKNKGSQEMFEEEYNALTGDDYDKIYYYVSNYNTEGNNRSAIIDTDGRIVWKSELTFSTKVLTETSDFKDGLAYCIFSGNNGDEFYIIDSDGNVTYKSEPSDDYRIICHDDGKFFVVKHAYDFDTDEWQLGVIDKNGNVIYPFKEYSKVYDNEEISDSEYEGYESGFDSLGIKLNNNVVAPLKKDNINDCCYLGNDILELKYHTDGYDDYGLSGYGTIFLNLKNQSIIYISEKDGNLMRYSDFEDGNALIWKDSFLGKMDTNGNITKILSNTWTSKVLDYTYDFSEGLTFIPFSKSSKQYDDFTLTNGVYYDTEGNIAISFDNYRGKHHYECGQFSNGYAVMCITGADGNDYYTIINKKGEQMFEPMSGYRDFKLSNDGKYICAFNTYSIDIYDTFGNKISTIKSKTLGKNSNIIVNDGIMNTSDCYINVKTGQIIGSVKFSLSDLSITVY